MHAFSAGRENGRFSIDAHQNNKEEIFLSRRSQATDAPKKETLCLAPFRRKNESKRSHVQLKELADVCILMRRGFYVSRTILGQTKRMRNETQGKRTINKKEPWVQVHQSQPRHE
ncbi:hypothetical protein ACMFMG_000663 [Clarireedia jacksonii]